MLCFLSCRLVCLRVHPTFRLLHPTESFVSFTSIDGSKHEVWPESGEQVYEGNLLPNGKLFIHFFRIFIAIIVKAILTKKNTKTIKSAGLYSLCHSAWKGFWKYLLILTMVGTRYSVDETVWQFLVEVGHAVHFCVLWSVWLCPKSNPRSPQEKKKQKKQINPRLQQMSWNECDPFNNRKETGVSMTRK